MTEDDLLKAIVVFVKEIDKDYPAIKLIHTDVLSKAFSQFVVSIDESNEKKEKECENALNWLDKMGRQKFLPDWASNKIKETLRKLT